MKRKIAGYFFKGLIVLIPLFLILFFIDLLMGLGALVAPGLSPALGVLATLASITLVGFLFSKGMGAYLRYRGTRLLSRVPILAFLFQSFRELRTAFKGAGEAFETPVWVFREDGDTERKIGFITCADAGRLGASEHVAVYIPEPFTFFGELVIVPKARVRPVEAEDPASVLGFVLSGGLSEGQPPRTTP